MKRSNKRNQKHKKRRYTRRHRKIRRYGGTTDNIIVSNPSSLVKQQNYIIQFYNDEENDDVETNFSPLYNGIYKYVEGYNLYPYHSKKGVSYYKFEKNGDQIFLFYEDDPVTYNNITTYFLMPVYYNDDDTMRGETPDYRWSDEYYNEYRQTRYRCNVYKTYTETDLLNVSRVSRLKKNIPIEMERNIQSFMVGKTKYDT